MQIRHFYREHKWEIILGLVFAVLFGIAWEGSKLLIEHTVHVEPERLAAGTLRVFVMFNLTSDAQRKIVEERQEQFHLYFVSKDYAVARMGSGFAVSDDGWIVTARHVVNLKPLEPLLAKVGARPIVVIGYPPDGDDRKATLIAEDPKADTAILKVINPLPNRTLVLGDTEDVHRLDRVVAAGYPSAGDITDPLEPTMTGGAISKIGRAGPFGKTFEITAPIGPGNSGGPLFDAEGRVIAINVAIPAAGSEPMIAFSVAIDRAKELLAARGADLPGSYEHQGVRHPWVAWAGVLLLLVWLVYAVIAWRSRLQQVRTPSAVALVAWIIDAAIVISLWALLLALAIVLFDAYWLSYGIVLAIPLVLVVNAKWSAGKRVARSRWGKLLLTPLALVMLFFGTFVLLRLLQQRALDDVERLHAKVWRAANAKAVPPLLAVERDRMAFLRWLPQESVRRNALYTYGLDLMRGGRPREAIDAFHDLVGRPWETLGPGTGLSYTSDEQEALGKAAWCYLDLGDAAHARQLFDLQVGDVTTDREELIGLGVALQRSGDAKGSRALCERAKKARVSPLRDYTPSQLRAVQQFLAQCN